MGQKNSSEGVRARRGGKLWKEQAVSETGFSFQEKKKKTKKKGEGAGGTGFPKGKQFSSNCGVIRVLGGGRGKNQKRVRAGKNPKNRPEPSALCGLVVRREPWPASRGSPEVLGTPKEGGWLGGYNRGKREVSACLSVPLQGGKKLGRRTI